MKMFLVMGMMLVSGIASAASLKEIETLKPPFKLAPLPYSTDALVAAIDQKTMEIHHGKHHQAYVDNLNKAIGKDKANLITILSQISSKEPAVRNNAGGHFNHTFFWQILTGDKEKQKMPERFEKELIANFGSIEKFKEAFEKAGTGQFGSGWVWLIRNEEGKLAITTTANQDNPLMDTATIKGKPILGFDVWEHAYYLNYQNKRADYLKTLWSVVNWSQVDEFDREITKK